MWWGQVGIPNCSWDTAEQGILFVGPQGSSGSSRPFSIEAANNYAAIDITQHVHPHCRARTLQKQPNPCLGEPPKPSEKSSQSGKGVTRRRPTAAPAFLQDPTGQKRPPPAPAFTVDPIWLPWTHRPASSCFGKDPPNWWHRVLT